MSSTSRKSSILRRAGGLAAVAGASSIALAIFATPAAAGGNPSFEGILSAATPTGFTSSPWSYTIPATVNFDVVVMNLTESTQTLNLNLSADHILTYDGVDVSDGQPGQPGITFAGPQGTTQSEFETQPFTQTWNAGQSVTLEESFAFNACGYYQLDIWAPVSTTSGGGGDSQRNRATLASGFVRILGCGGGGSGSPTPSPTASPTPTPDGGVQGTSTASPTPDGSVDAITTPTTGAGGSGGGLGLGVLLLAGGLVLLIASRTLAVHGRPLPRVEL